MDRSRYEEDGVMRTLKAEGLGSVCCDRFTRKILDRRPFSFGHTLLRSWSLMSREGIPNQSIGSGSVEPSFDAVLVLQGFGREPLEEVRSGTRRPVAFWVWRRRRRLRCERRGRWRQEPRLDRSQRVICSAVLGVVPSETRSEG